jgi:predicted NUDIX family NTP pyrophosphohydrolase
VEESQGHKVKKKSAGLMMYRFKGNVLEVFLAHMGGPFWAKKDEGAWSIPKGEYGDTEDPFAAAKREFKEETGLEPNGNFVELQTLKQPGGKEIKAWAFEGDCDPSGISSNTFELEWPPRSGEISEFPEIDRAEWFPTIAARMKILKGQTGFIDELCEKLGYDSENERVGFRADKR